MIVFRLKMPFCDSTVVKLRWKGDCRSGAAAVTRPPTITLLVPGVLVRSDRTHYMKPISRAL